MRSNRVASCSKRSAVFMRVLCWLQGKSYVCSKAGLRMVRLLDGGACTKLPWFPLSFLSVTTNWQKNISYLETRKPVRPSLSIRLRSLRTGLDPFTDEEIQRAVRLRDKLVGQYGAVIQRDYGWAAEALGNKSPDSFGTWKKRSAWITFDHILGGRPTTSTLAPSRMQRFSAPRSRCNPYCWQARAIPA